MTSSPASQRDDCPSKQMRHLTDSRERVTLTEMDPRRRGSWFPEMGDF